MEWSTAISPGGRVPRPSAPGIPAPLSAIVLKLLAKGAEDRYQTAHGLEHDLRICLADWQAAHRSPLPARRARLSDRLLIPEKLYGREHEIETLLAASSASSRRRAGARARLRLLRHRQVLGGQRAAAGPGAAARPSSPPASSISTSATSPTPPWRRPSGASSGSSSRERRELALARRAPLRARSQRPAHGRPHSGAGVVIGGQPGPRAAAERSPLPPGLSALPRRFTRAGHPLALFLDDLQWLDAATLELLEDLSQPGHAQPVAHRRLPRQRSRRRAPAQAQARRDPRRRRAPGIRLGR